MVSLSLRVRGGLQLIFMLKNMAFKAEVGAAAAPLALPRPVFAPDTYSTVKIPLSKGRRGHDMHATLIHSPACS